MSHGNGNAPRHYHQYLHHHFHHLNNTNTNHNGLNPVVLDQVTIINEPDADIDADAAPDAPSSSTMLPSKVLGLTMPSVSPLPLPLPLSPLLDQSLASSLLTIVPLSPDDPFASSSPPPPSASSLSSISSWNSSHASITTIMAESSVSTTDTVATVAPTAVDGAPAGTKNMGVDKNGKVKINSCTICHGQKVKCDGQRPCSRCIKMGRQAQCHDRNRGDKPIRTGRRIAAHLLAAKTEDDDDDTQHDDNPTIVNHTKQTLTTKVAASTKTTVKSDDCATKQRVNKRSSCSSSDTASSSASNTTMLVVSSSSSSAHRTASRSPARKRDRRTAADWDDSEPIVSLPSDTGQLVPAYPSDITKLVAFTDPSSSTTIIPAASGDIPADLALDGCFAAPFASHRDRSCSPSTETAVKWVSQLMTAIPRSVILTFDETSVTRTAFANLAPWLKATFTEDSAMRIKDPNSYLKRLSVSAPIRVCPACISPLRQCANCARPLAKGETLPFSDWLISTFFAAMWLPKQVSYVANANIENLPIPACFFTLELGKRCNPVKLKAHHQKMVDFMFSLSSVRQFVARGGLDASTPLSPTTATPSRPYHTNYTEHKVGNKTTWIESPRDPCVSSGDGTTTPIVTVFDDLFPADDPGTSVPPTVAYTASQEIERLLGYSRQELALRTQAAGWRMPLLFVRSDEATTLFQYMYGGIAGVVDEHWSMIGHILTKWGTVVRCLVAGFIRHVDGYRTAIEFYVPLPHDYIPTPPSPTATPPPPSSSMIAPPSPQPATPVVASSV